MNWTIRRGIVLGSVLMGVASQAVHAQYSSYTYGGYGTASPAYAQQPQTAQPQPARRGLASFFGGRGSAQSSYSGGQQANAWGQQPDAYGQQAAPASAAPQYGQPQQQMAYAAPADSGRYARTIAAGGGITGLTRPVNFPRDPGDDVDVLKLQVFLDYHGYSVGEIDGQWGYNTERALFVYQKNNGMPSTGQIDDRIIQRLNGFQDGYLLDYVVKPEDVKGPFNRIPRTYPEQEKLKWLPYESVAEALGEKFHCSQSLLRKLNPQVDFDNLQAGTSIYGLNVVDGIDDKRGKIALLKISKGNKWIEAFDSEKRFMFYFPSTLGSHHDDLKTGMYKVSANPIMNPRFTYKPSLMWDDEVGRVCDIPPGPNSPVGPVWIQTSKTSVGIHGTPNPENISKNFSHGCIRTCNWDAKQLAKRVEAGTPIEVVP